MGAESIFGSRQRGTLALRITASYAVVGLSWIFFSDQVLWMFSDAPDAFVTISTVKGFAYVLLTALLLYSLTSRGAGELERSRESLRESEQLFRKLFESLPLGVALIDPDNRRFRLFNDAMAESLGYTRSEFGALCLEDIEPGLDGSAIAEQHARLIHEEEERIQFETRLRAKSGELRDMLVDALAVEIGGRKLVLNINTNMTERKKTVARIVRQNAILEGINRIFREALSSRTKEDLGRTCLAVAEEVTGSRFGFLREIDPDGHGKNIAVSGLDRETRDMDDLTDRCGISDGAAPLHALRSGLPNGEESSCTKNPILPSGWGEPGSGYHPVLRTFLNIPLMRNEQSIGVLGVGNREGGYGHEELDALEALSPAVVQALLHKQAEIAVRKSLDEKVILLKEIHHRVKNNLQIVASLLGLQANRSKNPEVWSVLEDTRNRVKSMAMLHEALYRSGNLEHIDFGVYVRDLVAQLISSFGRTAERIRIEERIARIRLPLDQAVPCGLIVNELVSNTLKHAFPGERSGTVVVEMNRNADGMLQLKVHDNGVGLCPAVDPAGASTLGLKMVATLTGQLGGQMTVEGKVDAGTSIGVAFPVPCSSALTEDGYESTHSCR